MAIKEYKVDVKGARVFYVKAQSATNARKAVEKILRKEINPGVKLSPQNAPVSIA